MHTVTHFFLHGSPLLIYLIVAVVLMLESSGVPIANTTLLLLAGAMASFGHVSIWCLSVSAIAGSLTGALIAYILGLHGGRRMLLRVAAFFHIDGQKVRVAERWFSTSGVWMIFFSRMTPYIRPFACFPAGVSKMLLPHFIISAFSGSTIWCAAMLTVGWFLGRRWEQALALIQRYTIPAIGVLALLIALFMLISHAIKSRLQAALEASSARDDRTVKKSQSGLLKV